MPGKTRPLILSHLLVINTQAQTPLVGRKDEDFFIPMHFGHNNRLGLPHHPPIPAANLENQSMAIMPAHSD